MLRNEFDFTLHESLWKNPEDADMVFQAWSEKAYDVTFTYEKEELCVGYWKEEVEKHINEGMWIVLANNLLKK